MRYIEARRHTMRLKPGKHLSRDGVILARQVGEKLGPFDRVLTSPLPRAYETAIAMGFAVDKKKKNLSQMGAEVEAEVNWQTGFAGFAEAVKKGGAASRLASKLAKSWKRVALTLPEGGSALIITHGGLIEAGTAGCLPNLETGSWPVFCGYCEGVRLSFDGKSFVGAEYLRNE